MTDNYVDIRHEYTGLPDEFGLRLRSTDVWFATKPNIPEYDLIDSDGDPIPFRETRVITAWTLGKVGAEDIHIHDRDDINGLRKLLDRIELAMDTADMADMTSEFEDELDTETPTE